MKKLLAVLLSITALTAAASETILIQNPYGPSHSGNSALMRVTTVANEAQKKYTFILEPRPGANQSIALNHINQYPQTEIAVIAASFVENSQNGLVNGQNYVPLWSLGDACWAAFSIKGTMGSIASMRGTGEIVASSVGIGNATHLTSLVIGEKLGLPVRYVVHRSSNEALINMAGNNGVTFTVDRAENYENFKDRNPNLTIVGMSCPHRHPAYPTIKTLKEQGIESPYVFNTVVAHKDMDQQKRREIAAILTQSAEKIGKQWILENTGFVPPQFSGQTAQQHLDQSVALISKLRTKYAKEISISK